MSALVEAKGLDQVRRAFARAAPNMRRALTAEMRAIAVIATTYAKEIAAAKGLHDSGDLIKGLRPGARRSSALIRETALHRDYPYPGIYEYAGSTHRESHGHITAVSNRSAIGQREILKHGMGSVTRGPRAFMEPAAQRSVPEVMRRLEQLGERILRRIAY